MPLRVARRGRTRACPKRWRSEGATPKRLEMKGRTAPLHAGGCGTRFTEAYTHMVCCPARAALFTLNQQLPDAGYLISMFAKNNHHRPAAKFCVDVADDKISRHPSQLTAATRKCRRGASEQGRPDLAAMLATNLAGSPASRGQLLQPAWDRRAVDQRRQIRRALDPDDVAGETGQDQQQDRVPRSIGDVATG